MTESFRIVILNHMSKTQNLFTYEKDLKKARSVLLPFIFYYLFWYMLEDWVGSYLEMINPAW